MEKRTECEIVEDLLFGYVDGVLNTESKKIVEKHLTECENCQKKLKEIKNDIKENEDKQKKQVDYLKKVRRKNKIKSILIAAGIILIIIFIKYLYNFIIFNNVLYKAKQTLKSNNMYIEMAESFTGEGRFLSKKYFKDGKYKKVDEILTDDGFKINSITYTSVGSDEKVTFLEVPKKVIIEKNEENKILNSEENLKLVSLFVRDDRLIIRFVIPIIMKVEGNKDMPLGSYYSNKKCFKFKDRINEDEPRSRVYWIDKETGLPLKTLDKETRGEMFNQSDVVKQIKDNICEYKYEFNIVTDEELEIPSFDGYEIEYSE